MVYLLKVSLTKSSISLGNLINGRDIVVTDLIRTSIIIDFTSEVSNEFLLFFVCQSLSMFV